MNWIEVIEIRTTMQNRSKVESHLKKLIKSSEKPELVIMKTYVRSQLDTDYCIQLMHDADEYCIEGSSLGQHLISAFKELGQIKHRIWVEYTP